jgi:hypothetical protein
MVSILPRFDLERPAIEQEFVCKVELLQSELGEDIVILSAQNAFILTTWIKIWPEEVRGRWKLFNIKTANSTISQFLDNFTFWLMDARTKKVESENVGYIVSSGPFSSWLGPQKKKEITSTSLTGSNPHNLSSKDHKRKLTNLPPSDPTPPVDTIG